jgi:hypothetical protein
MLEVCPRVTAEEEKERKAEATSEQRLFVELLVFNFVVELLFKNPPLRMSRAGDH